VRGTSPTPAEVLQSTASRYEQTPFHVPSLFFLVSFIVFLYSIIRIVFYTSFSSSFDTIPLHISIVPRVTQPPTLSLPGNLISCLVTDDFTACTTFNLHLLLLCPYISHTRAYCCVDCPLHPSTLFLLSR
jgi:hypothetical protein